MVIRGSPHWCRGRMVWSSLVDYALCHIVPQICR
ncbi:hypothetical protein CASFOL_006967 [Castilleja foliolosa]|uniref:Uncharacterized protein n=1 Tax=Castilleja foliolosa TaxID=1961234 RepID=A0ABD3E8T3_9LAMI